MEKTSKWILTQETESLFKTVDTSTVRFTLLYLPLMSQLPLTRRKLLIQNDWRCVDLR